MITTAGRFDRDRALTTFLVAGAVHVDAVAAIHPYLKIGAHELTDLEAAIASGAALLLDFAADRLRAGHARRQHVPLAATAALAPEDLDGWTLRWAAYVSACVLHGDRAWGYLAPAHGGPDTKRAQLAALADLGLRPMPVYSLTDGWDYFDELAAGYDRIAVEVGFDDARAQRRAIDTAATRCPPATWLHLVGARPSALPLTYPTIRSTDCAAWLSATRLHATEVCVGDTSCGRYPSASVDTAIALGAYDAQLGDRLIALARAAFDERGLA